MKSIADLDFYLTTDIVTTVFVRLQFYLEAFGSLQSDFCFNFYQFDFVEIQFILKALI